jgi:hypothetical protein
MGDLHASGASPVLFEALRDFRPLLAGVLARRLSFLVGSAVRIERLAVMARPAGLYGGEITGKG